MSLFSIILQTIGIILLTDFLSGFFHWLEDAYGREDWPITGRLITQPNILHHHHPRYFTRHNWLQSSWLLMSLGAVIALLAWLCGALTWQLWLLVLIGSNANQVHKWAHRSPAENGPLITALQTLRIIQTGRHHALHHADPKASHYCVLTNLLNPILEQAQFWRSLERLVSILVRVNPRQDSSVRREQPVNFLDARNAPADCRSLE